MSSGDCSHGGEELEGEHPGLGEVGHDAHSDGEQATGVLHQSEPALLEPRVNILRCINQEE